jgi:hypothetical protein
VEDTVKLEPSALPIRLAEVFISPGKLFTSLKEKPLWFGTLLAGALFVALAVLAIPGEIMVEASREEIIRRGGEVPTFMEGAGTLFKIFGILGAVVFWFVWAFALAGIATVVFAFVLGDEGRYVQYLSVVSHALIIGAVGSLLIAPLRIAQGDPSLTLSLGTYAFFLEEGYPLRVLRMLDLFGLWGYLVMAIGVTRIDPRRGLGSAVGVFSIFALGLALLFGIPGG